MKRIKITTASPHSVTHCLFQFLPFSGNGLAASGAADSRVQVHDLSHGGSSLQIFKHHFGRVKRLEIAPDEPNLFWSAAEDGVVMQFDLRCSEGIPSVFANLSGDVMSGGQAAAEAKCIAINPTKTHLVAVGANDAYVRLYDRRMVRPQKVCGLSEGSGKMSNCF